MFKTDEKQGLLGEAWSRVDQGKVSLPPFLHLSLTHTVTSKDFVLFCSEGFHGISSKAALVKLNFHMAIFKIRLISDH